MKYITTRSPNLMRGLHTLAFVVLFLTLLVVAVAIYLIVDVANSSSTTIKEPDGPIKSALTVKGKQQFQTEDFSFEAPEGWRYLEEQSTVGSVYRFSEFQGTYVKRNLEVKINNTKTPEVEYVVPVVADGSGFSSVGTTYQACSEYLNTDGSSESTEISLGGVTFKCLNDKNSFVAGAGLVDSGLNMPLGESGKTFFITYTDAGNNPDFRKFEEILNSFKY